LYIYSTRFKLSHGQPAALEVLQCGPSKASEKRYFGAKSIESLEKSKFRPSKWRFFQKCGPRADLGWPWLIQTVSGIFYFSSCISSFLVVNISVTSIFEVKKDKVSYFGKIMMRFRILEKLS
jgi:hypothetical protein